MEPLILPVRPGTLRRKAINELQRIRVIVVECPDPSELRLLRPSNEVDGSDLLRIALKALCKNGGYGDKGELQRQTFTILLSKYMNSKFDPTAVISKVEGKE